MHGDETRHIILYRTASFVKDFIIHDTKWKCFTYRSDETTSSKVEKQYGRYITNFSDFFKQLIRAYSGSLFVGHCTNKDLLQHFHCFMYSLDLSTNWLLNIGMDSPTVNTSFLYQLKSEIEESHQSFIDIGTCPLHITNNFFKAILNVLKTILDLGQRKLHNGNYNTLYEKACRITLAEHRSFTCPNTRANGEFEKVFFEGDTEPKGV